MRFNGRVAGKVWRDLGNAPALQGFGPDARVGGQLNRHGGGAYDGNIRKLGVL